MDNYQFTEKWFDPMIPTWEQIFNTPKSFGFKPKDILEVGCYEGRATMWLCDNTLIDDGETKYNYDIVDTFGGSLEESGMTGTSERLKEGDFIYNNFIHNISFHPHINFEIYRGLSGYELPQLVKKGKQYDFIYIDASHRADDTFVDAYYAHQMLKDEGIIIFDDLGWKDPNRPHPVNSPELGVRMFLSCYNNEYTPLFQGYQIGLIKKETTNG